MLGKLNILWNFYIWVLFLKIYGLNGLYGLNAYNMIITNLILGMGAANLFLHNMSSFRGLKKYLESNSEMKFWNCTEFWILSEWLTFQPDSVYFSSYQ